jgi:uncharacterized membrane protein
MSSRTGSGALWMVPAASWTSMALSAWWLLSHRDELGSRVATHYDWQGRPDTWRANTPQVLLTPIVVGACAVAIVAIVTWLLHRTWSGGAGTPGATRRNPQAVQRVLLGTEIVVAAVSILGALAPWIGAAPLLVAGCSAVPIGLIAYVLATQPGVQGGQDGRAADDPHWRGVFYVNREDEAVWVPKRSGLGYTLNLAHRVSWFILGLFLLFPIVIIGVQFLQR